MEALAQTVPSIVDEWPRIDIVGTVYRWQVSEVSNATGVRSKSTIVSLQESYSKRASSIYSKKDTTGSVCPEFGCSTYTTRKIR